MFAFNTQCSAAPNTELSYSSFLSRDRRDMGNGQSHSHHHNGHAAMSGFGGATSRGKRESMDSVSDGSPISKEEMESRFSQLVVSFQC